MVASSPLTLLQMCSGMIGTTIASMLDLGLSVVMSTVESSVAVAPVMPPV